MPIATAILAGLLFGLGVAISGMIDPAKVLNFFDVAGTWDPTLATVMAGALPVTLIGYRLAWRRRAPLFEPDFTLPTRRTVDARLIGGAALFGIGWGLAGFCPGPAVAALVSGHIQPVVFVACLLAGMALARRLPFPAGPAREAEMEV